MTDANGNGAGGAEARTLAIERVFAAPPDRVFNAWTDPAVLARWWGPESHTIADVSIDLREGGEWMTVMVSPEGDRHHVSGVYLEIVPPRRLVFTWAWTGDGGRGHETTVTVTFEPHPAGTLMHFHQATFAAAEHARLHNQGWTSTFDGFDRFIAGGGLD
jgi:glutathione S-transferase